MNATPYLSEVYVLCVVHAPVGGGMGKRRLIDGCDRIRRDSSDILSRTRNLRTGDTQGQYNKTAEAGKSRPSVTGGSLNGTPDASNHDERGLLGHDFHPGFANPWQPRL